MTNVDERVRLLADFAQWLNTSEGGAVEPGYDDRADVERAAEHFLLSYKEPEVEHVLEIREDGWGLEHPRRCREGGKSLLDCPVYKAATHSLVVPSVPGRYRVRVADDEAKKLAFLGDADA